MTEEPRDSRLSASILAIGAGLPTCCPRMLWFRKRIQILLRPHFYSSLCKDVKVIIHS